MKPTRYAEQQILDEDIKNVIDTLQSDYLTQGPQTLKFEKSLSEFCGSEFAVSCNSATSALHLACLALGIGPQSLVWTSPISFVASANCAVYCQSDIDFVDIDINTANIDTTSLKAKLELSRRKGRLPNAIIVVHMGGAPADLEKISELSKEFGFKVIEDASHALGATYKGSTVGSCKYSDLTVFSFHAVKIITAGEGGAVTCNSPELQQKMERARSHGITRDRALLLSDNNEPWYYEQHSIGFNYRMSDIGASLCNSQLQRLDTNIQRRNQIASLYTEKLSQSVFSCQKVLSNSLSAFHLFICQLDFAKKQLTKKQLFEHFQKIKVNLNVHYIPIHLQPFYRSKGFKDGQFPQAEEYYARAFSLPMHLNLTDEMVIIIAGELLNFAKKCK